MRHLKIAYILLWFPKPSETFVFREVINLQKIGLPLIVFTLYGRLKKSAARDLSPEMQSVAYDVVRLGIQYIKEAHRDIFYWLKKDPVTVIDLTRKLLRSPWCGFEKMGENLWAFVCAFRLARYFIKMDIEHIHAPWASGPATAAWIASKLTGIPFSFTARAWDIYPPDGLIMEKMRDASLIRCETGYNVRHLTKFADCDISKIKMSYNGVPLGPQKDAPVHMAAPYKLLALGRFVGKKGYDYLIHACKILKDAGLDFHMTLAGDGPMDAYLKRLTVKLGLTGQISFPGFIPHDRIPELFHGADIFLMPSIVHSSGDRDGIPTVIMESLLHRVPVIATDVSGISELIEHNVTGLLIPEKDPLSIAKAVTSIVKDRQLAIKMAENGKTKVLQDFNPDRNAQLIAKLYGQFIPFLRPKSAATGGRIGY
jgi:glycosyltransferase involved in cell wall biosynthesis